MGDNNKGNFKYVDDENSSPDETVDTQESTVGGELPTEEDVNNTKAGGVASVPRGVTSDGPSGGSFAAGQLGRD